jgi:hypothetical protein
MSALGQKRTSPPHFRKSVLPPEKRTSLNTVVMSAKCQKQTFAIVVNTPSRRPSEPHGATHDCPNY